MCAAQFRSGKRQRTSCDDECWDCGMRLVFGHAFVEENQKSGSWIGGGGGVSRHAFVLPLLPPPPTPVFLAFDAVLACFIVSQRAASGCQLLAGVITRFDI